MSGSDKWNPPCDFAESREGIRPVISQCKVYLVSIQDLALVNDRKAPSNVHNIIFNKEAEIRILCSDLGLSLRQ